MLKRGSFPHYLADMLDLQRICTGHGPVQDGSVERLTMTDFMKGGEPTPKGMAAIEGAGGWPAYQAYLRRRGVARL